MRPVYILLLLVLAGGCTPDFWALDPIYLDHITISGGRIDWFTYSAAYADFPDWATIEKNGKVDTLCSAYNLAKIGVAGPRIMLTFYGRPRLGAKPFPKTWQGYTIVVDTIHAEPGEPFKRRKAMMQAALKWQSTH